MKIYKSLLAIGVAVCIAITACGVLVACNNVNNNDGMNIFVGTASAIERAVRDEYAYDMLASGVAEVPLISKDANGQFSSVLVDWATEDSIRWTYTVKDGIKWSDGTPVTAEDIVFSLIYEGTENKPAFSTQDKTGTYESFELSADKKSVVLVLANANVKALDGMTGFRIRPKHIYENKTANELTDADKRVSCGPYKLESFNKEANTLKFVRNEYFPLETNADTVTYKIFSSEEIMYAALINGELDFVWNYSMGVPSAYQKILGNVNSVKLESATATNCPAMLVFNNKTGLFSNKNLRFAASYALDYHMFKEYFGSEFAQTPNRSFAPLSLVGAKQTEQLETNLDKASEYMAAAGYTKNGNGKWEKNGAVATFELTINAGKETHVGYAEFVKTQLDAFGFDVVLDAVNGTQYNVKTSNKFATEQGSGVVTMEAAIMGYTAFGMQNLGDMYMDGNHAVQGGAQVFSDTLTQIRKDMAEATTLEEYVSAAGRLQDFYASETPAIALYWDSMIYAHSVRVSNLAIDATFGLNGVNTWFSIAKA